MKISAKGRYALRLMIDVAEQSSGTPVKVREIAGRQNIPEKYCEQIVSALSRGGLLTSVRGAQGGYLLNGEPKEITAGDILRITEGDLDFGGEVTSSMSRGETATEMLFEKLNTALSEVLDNTTLEDLLSWQPGAGDDYII